MRLYIYIYVFTMVLGTSCVMKNSYEARLTLKLAPDTIVGQPSEDMIDFELYIPDPIKAFTDEDAYKQAYICFSLELLQSSRIDKMFSRNRVVSIEKAELLNEKGEDIIPSLNFPDREKKEKAWWEGAVDYLEQHYMEEDLNFMVEQPQLKQQ